MEFFSVLKYAHLPNVTRREKVAAGNECIPKILTLNIPFFSELRAIVGLMIVLFLMLSVAWFSCHKLCLLEHYNLGSEYE